MVTSAIIGMGFVRHYKTFLLNNSNRTDSFDYPELFMNFQIIQAKRIKLICYKRKN